MSFINGLSVKSPIETDSLANTVIRKSTGLFKSVNTFLLSLLSVGLTQVLSSSLRSREKIWSQCSEIQSGYELNFRHARFISYLFTILSQGILHFTPHGIHFNHDSRNSFFFIKSRLTERKTIGSRRYENTLGSPSYSAPHYISKTW